MNSEQELIKALQSLEVGVEPEIEYRLHYDDRGNIIMCSMRDPHPESSQYLVVTQKEYDSYFKFCVVNGKLKYIETNTGHRPMLVKSKTGFRVVKSHPAVLLEDQEHYQNTEYYDYRNS